MSALARTTDPSTSHQAAASVKASTVKRLQLLIIEVMEDQNQPMTDEEIFSWVDYKGYIERGSFVPSSVRTRRSELVKKGLIRASAERGVTQAGRACTKWQLVPRAELEV